MADFLRLAPLFSNVIDIEVSATIIEDKLNTQSLVACLKRKKNLKRHMALRHAISAMAYWRIGAKLESQKQVALARSEVDLILDSGLIRRIAVDVLPSELRVSRKTRHDTDSSKR